MKFRFLVGLFTLFLGWPLQAAERAPARPIDLNRASATELMQLPRVGPRTAARIVAFRRAHGAFQRPEELMDIKGIGEKAWARLRAHVTVRPGAVDAGAEVGGDPGADVADAQ